MIDDSVPWKNELLRIAGRLERRRSQKRWTGKTSFLIERDIMVAAFAIRKLIEAHKLSDDVTSHQVAVMRHSLSGRIPDHTRTARYEWLMTGHGYTSEPPAVLDVDCSAPVPSDADQQQQTTRSGEQ